MNALTFLYVVAIAISFIAWPIIGAYSKAGSMWVGPVVIFFTALTTGLMFFRQTINTPAPRLKSMVLLIFAGVINGIGIYLYTIKATDQTVPTSLFVVSVSVFMVVLAPFFDWALNNQILLSRQWLGIILAVVAIFLVAK